ncbi:MAG: hypothetical protein IJK81_13655 [Selenomonadaceae bacterium]|nr:hypothetical protein [Selenomonadaceae bacterium]
MKRTKLIEFRGGRTQLEMSKIYSVTQQTWSLWELGITTPLPHIMKRLQDDSGISMEELFFDAFNNQKSYNNSTTQTEDRNEAGR